MMTDTPQVPTDLYYTDNHTWVLIEGDTATVGMSDYAQEELSEIVYIDLPEVGDNVVQGSPFGTIEAMKTVAELIAPVTGAVIEVNYDLIDNPKTVNNDPYGDGWMIRVRLSDPEEVDNILTPDDYLVYITGE